MAHIFGFITATAVTWENGDSEEYAEEHGWVDLGWSRTELWESRNDVRPLVSCDENDPELMDYIREAFDDLPAGPYRDNGDGTWYGEGEHLDRKGTSYTYAFHLKRKHHDPRRGWVEDDFIPLGLYPATQ